MKQEIIITSDGSTSIFLPEWEETYHSKHGAIQEAYHVFIKNGLDLMTKPEISVLEIGFGTGLNAFITFLEAQKRNVKINYFGIEAFPVDAEIIEQLNYVSELKANQYKSEFEKIHSVAWEKLEEISSHFSIQKNKMLFEEIEFENQFDCIYFDAFGFQVQPELWSLEIFKKMYNAMKPNGILVTYACRSSIKKAMLESGFSVEKLPGAPGKREMLRGMKK